MQARVGTGYGTPATSNLFVTPAGVNGNNTQLQSQTNTGIDTGVDITASRFLTVGVAGYYEWFRNELLTQSPGVNLLAYTFNAPRSIHRGIEAMADWRMLRELAPGLRLRMSYTFMNQTYDDYVEQLSAGTFFQAFNRAGNKIPGVTPVNLVARLVYDQVSGVLAGLGGYVETTYRDQTWLDNANLLQAPGYTLVNVNLHYDGGFRGHLKRLHLLCEVQNVANKVWVGSAANLSDSLSATTGLESGTSVLAATTGTIYAGAPRSFFTGARVGF